jgi:hypothetical protein
MSFLCAHCGETHDELPQYFLCRTPENANGKVLNVKRDGKSMCRGGKKRFVACEVEFPFEDSDIEPLGYVCWAEVAPKDYKALEKFWKTEAPEDDPGPVAGTLANELTGIPDTYGTRVRFIPLAKDPTPYVRWIDPESPLGRLVEARITQAFWHGLVTAVHSS